MNRRRGKRAWLVALVALAAGCNSILGIDSGTLDEGGDAPRVPCETAEDCPAKACQGQSCGDDGSCAYTFTAKGTALPEQEAGDCRTLVCDGAGGLAFEVSPTDVDDGKPCTVDTCVGMTPTHEPAGWYECYDEENHPGTKGKGICRSGIRLCGPDDEPMGECMGQVLPREETCLYPLDEDCDGLEDEGGEGC